jgi:hypothetical protein
MHKSGTTLVAQILHHSGVNMVDDLDENVSYDQGNKYERQSVLRINMDILGLPNYEVIGLEAPSAIGATPDQRRRMEDIVTACAESYGDWGFKDPRTCLTYPLWADVLPEHKIIAVYREPGQLAKHFVSPHPLRAYRAPATTWRYINRWYEYNMMIIKHLNMSSRGHLMLSYNELMRGDREFDRLQAFVGRELVDRRRKDLYRGRDAGNSLFRACDWLLKRRRGRSTSDVMALLGRLRG